VYNVQFETRDSHKSQRGLGMDIGSRRWAEQVRRGENQAAAEKTA
jgi:hypothetical protein